MTLIYLFSFFLALSLGLSLYFFLDKARRKAVLGLAVLSGAFALGFGGFFIFYEPEPQAPAAAADSLEAVVGELHSRLLEDPDNVEGWATLGAGYFALGRFSEAVEAYISASRLDPANPFYHAAIGESVTLAYGGTVTEDAKAAFDAALALDPENEVANLYLGDYEFQAGEIEAAFRRWQALYDRLPPDTTWIEVVENRLAKARETLDENPSPR